MSEENEIKEEETGVKCDPVTKPTYTPPGGSSQGWWGCDNGSWVWNDTIA